MTDLILESANSYLSKLDDIELKYNIFLAENEMNKKMIQLGSDIVLENNISLYSINESVKEWIITFGQRISEALQKAWDKLKIIFGEGKDLAYLRSIKNKVESMTEDPNFNINNIRVYDNIKYTNFKIKTFDYDAMKESLDSEKHFLSTNYSELGFTDNDSNIKEVCNNYFVEIKDEPINCTATYVKNIFNWCYNDYIKQINSIENNMKLYNSSTKNIETFANNVLNQQETMKSNDQETMKSDDQKTSNTTSDISESCTLLYEHYILEGVNDNKKENNMTFQDNNDKNVNTNSESNISDAVKIFFTATTGILSSLFIIIKNQKADYLRILKHCFPVKKSEDDSDIIEDNKETNNNTSSSIPQIK